MDLFRIEIKEKTKAKRGIKNSSWLRRLLIVAH
jgi:hypothetical protein